LKLTVAKLDPFNRATRVGRTSTNLERVDFLVEIEIRLPGDLAPALRAELLADELARGVELAEAGTIRAIWRVPGRLANRGIWSAPDATELHVAITSLPLWPHMDVTVTPLAAHPLTDSCLGIPAALGGEATTERPVS
jgi:muconolactone D-isomerase